MAADPLVEILGDDRLPHQSWRQRLVSLDDAYDLWGIACWLGIIFVCVLSWFIIGMLVYYLAG